MFAVKNQCSCQIPLYKLIPLLSNFNYFFFSSVKCEESASISSLFSGTTAHSGYQKDIFDTETTQSGAKTKTDLGL